MRDLQLGTNLLSELLGYRPSSFAAPGWRISPSALKMLHRLGYVHISCARGRAPFRPLVNGRPLPLLEIPSTLPTMDEILGRRGVKPEDVDRALWERLVPGGLNVFTLHGEVEGRQLAPAFSRLLDRCLTGGVAVITMLEAARQTLAGADVPVDSYADGSIHGRAGLVAWQASALAGRERIH
jgi:peptidoglycan/xylan/chitin deacetylase (PgdA/CDA1 family)